MTLSINSNISALNALGKRQATSANNIANSDSEGFKKSRMVLEEGEKGMVTAKSQAVNTPGTMINQPNGSMTETSNVDLATEVTDMIPTKHAYQANLKALQTTAEMEKATLDLIG
ncbi:flagellar basal body rod C-terminal domain-containing protein [Pelovirga terrestris]|uniref:Flagellar biosynthesis protein FlgC n=1 Tax=Pelovirga terrestris TaxID=2771352 RepID=A0A8J6URJ1_9BACT|nr:flagellar basal body rod C-terminal domain-containing protein [Pelovirga terrestris]MBD1401461.1 flagellar biosynthesis protein FlgC [Pelovirga terrestris]